MSGNTPGHSIPLASYALPFASFIIIAVHAEEVLWEEMIRDAQTSAVVIVFMGLGCVEGV